MTARIDASELTPELARRLGVDQAARKRPRPSRAEAMAGRGTWRCVACHAVHASRGAAERHGRTTGHARIELVLDQEGGQQ